MISRQYEKSSLSAFIDRRFILEDGLCCLTFRQFEVPDIFLLRAVVGNYDGVQHYEPEEEFLTNISIFSSPIWSRIIRDFNVSPSARVLSLNHFDAAEKSNEAHEHNTLSLYSEKYFSPPDLGYIQRIYSVSEMEDPVDCDKETKLTKSLFSTKVADSFPWWRRGGGRKFMLEFWFSYW